MDTGTYKNSYKNLKEINMADMVLGGLVTAGLLIYLGYVLIKAEEF